MFIRWVGVPLVKNDSFTRETDGQLKRALIPALTRTSAVPFYNAPAPPLPVNEKVIARLRKEMDEELPDIDTSLKDEVARTEERDTSFRRQVELEKIVRERAIRLGMIALLKSVFSADRSKCSFEDLFSKRFNLYGAKDETASLIVAMNETQLMARLRKLREEAPQAIKINSDSVDRALVIEVNVILLAKIQ